MAATPIDASLHRWTRLIAIAGFTGLVVMALLTLYDGSARWLGLPRLSGFSDFGQVVYAIVISTCFPAGLLQGHNITIRFAGRAAGPRAAAWLETVGAAATLAFFALLVWQFFYLTLDLQANNRTTRTIEMPLAPWWWITPGIMALCVPVQAWVLLSRLDDAIRGRGPQVQEQMTSETVGDGRD